jgi:hypothetical protein
MNLQIFLRDLSETARIKQASMYCVLRDVRQFHSNAKTTESATVWHNENLCCTTLVKADITLKW